MSSGTAISIFFAEKFFEIPKYQRGYAWERRNVQDLFNDIKEANEVQAGHYLGTIVLAAKQKEKNRFFVVDGQQRITTIILLVHEIIERLPKNDRNYYKRFYIKEGNQYRLLPLNRDRQFFIDLFEGNAVTPQNKSQRFLLDAKETLKTCIGTLTQEQLSSFFQSVTQLEVLSFIENSEGDAIRIFQTVNDRGKPLSTMEKTKSLLIYYSNRYLKGELDEWINESFSNIFEYYDDIKQIGEDIGINLIRNQNFTEDNLLRYHFVTFSESDYDPTPAAVLLFLRSKLNELRTDSSQLSNFISNYTTGIKLFFANCEEILKLCSTDVFVYKLFVSLGLSATLYPLIVKLKQKNILFEKIFNDDSTTRFIDLVEIIDVRVYKTRGTDPKAEIARLLSSIESLTNEEIRDNLLGFNQRWMTHENFSNNLSRNAYGNQAMQYIFLTYCEKIDDRKYSLDEVIKITNETPNIEHILAQTPNFSPAALGFNDSEDFASFEHSIGNLVSLERKFNSEIKNKVPVQKTSTYDKSIISAARKLGTSIALKMRFNKTDLEKRSAELVNFCTERWWSKHPTSLPTIEAIPEDIDSTVSSSQVT